MKKLTLLLLFGIILIMSCKTAFKPATLEQIEKLKAQDLPLIKFNEFGEAYYKEHPCSENIFVIGTRKDTTVQNTLIEGQINYLADLAERYKRQLDSITADNASNYDECLKQKEKYINLVNDLLYDIHLLRKDSAYIYNKVKNINTTVFIHDKKLLDMCNTKLKEQDEAYKAGYEDYKQSQIDLSNSRITIAEKDSEMYKLKVYLALFSVVSLALAILFIKKAI